MSLASHTFLSIWGLIHNYLCDSCLIVENLGSYISLLQIFTFDIGRKTSNCIIIILNRLENLVLSLHRLLHGDKPTLLFVLMRILVDHMLLKVVLVLIVDWDYIFHSKSMLLSFLLALLLEPFSISIVKRLLMNSILEKLRITRKMLLKALVPLLISHLVVIVRHEKRVVRHLRIYEVLSSMSYRHLAHWQLLLLSECSYFIVWGCWLSLVDMLSFMKIFCLMNPLRLLLTFSNKIITTIRAI